jgi:predicted membrane-bound spermidine synthase
MRWSMLRGAMRLRLALAVAALSGFVALSYEIVWYRVLAVMTRGTAATFGLLLAAYLLGLAVGARASARFCRGEGGDPGELRVIALFVAVANAIAALVVPAFAWSARFTDYRIGLAIVTVGAAFLGSVLPLVSHFGIEPDDRAGSRLSYVYLANILGSAAGSLVTGFVLMDAMPLASIARVLVAFGFALAAALVALSRPSRGAALRAGGALACATALALALAPRLYDRLWERLILKNEFDGTQRFPEVVETKSGVITVAADGTVYGGGAYDGVLNTSLANNDLNGILRAYIVGALHPAPREVLMVGLSSGSWAEVVVSLPGVERLTVVEINPGYVEVIARHPEVAPLLKNPRVSIVFDDGRRWLRRHDDARFDFIVMNTTQHWRGHATNVLSRDFMEIARRHLAPGGILYFNTTDSYDVQLTAAKTFPHFKRIANFVAVSDGPFDFDRPRWRRLLETMRIEGKPVIDLASEDGRKLLGELVGYNDIEPAWSIVERYDKTQRVVTDDNMVVEWLEPLRYPDLDGR